MSDLVHARVVEHLRRLTLGNLAERIDSVLNEAARTQPTYLEFLDRLLCDEMSAKRIASPVPRWVSLGRGRCALVKQDLPAIATLAPDRAS